MKPGTTEDVHFFVGPGVSFRFRQVGLVLSLHDGTLDGPWPGNRGERLVGEMWRGEKPWKSGADRVHPGI